MNVILDNGNISLNLDDFDTLEDLKKELLEILDCEEDDLLERTEEDFTVELEGFSEMCFDGLNIDTIWRGYQNLNSFDKYEQEVIAAYICLEDCSLDCHKDFMNEAVDHYFGNYEDDYDAAEEFLCIYQSMNKGQIEFVLNDLDASGIIVERYLMSFGNYYFFQND